MNDVELKT